MAKIDFPKKQEQRLIPKYLLEYAEELQENHPDPTDPWGGSGGDVNIKAGTGITITTESDDTKVISLDTNPDVFEVTADTGMTLEVTNTNPLWTDAKLQMAYTGATRLEGTLIDLYASNGMYFHSDSAPYYVNNTTHEYKQLATTDQLFSGNYNDLTNKPTIPDAVSGTNDGTNWTSLTIGNDTYGLASGGGTSYTAGTGIDITGTTISIDTTTVAMKTDIPTDVSDLNNDAGYITGITSSDVTTALGYTPYDSSNPSGYITGINSSDVITALGYTPGTSNFSGNYNDLTNKPTIPTATSQLTNDSGFITSADIPTNTYYYKSLSSSGGTLSTADLNAITSSPKKYILTINRVQYGNPYYFFYENDSSTYIYYITPLYSDTSGSYSYVEYKRGRISINKSTGIYTISDSYDSDSVNRRIELGTGLTGSYSESLGKETISVDTTTVALKADIPTVNDPTITFTQGGVTKGTITLNQSSNQTIALDAGGSGGSDNMIDIGPITSSTFNLTADQLSAIEDGAIINLSVTYPVSAIDYNVVLQPFTYDDTLYTYYVYRNYQYDNNDNSNLGPSLAIRELRITTAGACTYSVSINNLSKVARTGDYSDLTNTPTIPTTTSQLTNNSGYITNTVNNLTNYTLTSNLATVATSGSYNDLTNKPTIPTVNDNTITITQGGVTKGSFTLNQNTNQTIDVDDVPGMIGEVIFSRTPTTGQDVYSINLSKSITNYEYIEIYYNTINNTNEKLVKKLANAAVNDIFNLQHFINNTGTNRLYTINDSFTITDATTITFNNSIQQRVGNSEATNVGSSATNMRNRPYKIIGYKQNSAPIVIPDFEYHNGDTYENRNYYQLYGYSTNGGKDLQFTVTFNKSLANISSVTVNKIAIVTRGVGGYVGTNSYVDYAADTTNYTVSALISSDNAITITIRGTTAWSNVTNNTPVCAVVQNVAGALKLTFNS